jgi:putative membrane protein
MSLASAPTLEEIDAALALSRCFGAATSGGWSLAPALLVPLAATLVIYGIGACRLWGRARLGREALLRDSGLFLAGWALMALALVSPLHDVSRRLFSAHMIEHEIVMTAAAPLLVLARPGGTMMWALPQLARRMIGLAIRTRLVSHSWSMATAPIAAAAIHAAAIWIWHIPSVFAAALAQEWLHWLQHLSFLASALLFWWAIFYRAGHRFLALGLLFATSIHTSLLGALLAFSTRLWIPAQGTGAAGWNMTALDDQQLAGLIMWIPGGVAYLAAAIWLASVLIADPGHQRGRLTYGTAP